MPGFADILLKLDRQAGAGPADRPRGLLALSRHASTSPEQVLELNGAGPEDDSDAGGRGSEVFMSSYLLAEGHGLAYNGWPG